MGKLVDHITKVKKALIPSQPNENSNTEFLGFVAAGHRSRIFSMSQQLTLTEEDFGEYAKNYLKTIPVFRKENTLQPILTPQMVQFIFSQFEALKTELHQDPNWNTFWEQEFESLKQPNLSWDEESKILKKNPTLEAMPITQRFKIISVLQADIERAYCFRVLSQAKFTDSNQNADYMQDFLLRINKIYNKDMTVGNCIGILTMEYKQFLQQEHIDVTIHHFVTYTDHDDEEFVKMQENCKNFFTKTLPHLNYTQYLGDAAEKIIASVIIEKLTALSKENAKNIARIKLLTKMLPKNIQKKVKSDVELTSLTKLTPKKMLESASKFATKRFSSSSLQEGKDLHGFFNRFSMTPSTTSTLGKPNTLNPSQKISVTTNTAQTPKQEPTPDLFLKSNSAPAETSISSTSTNTRPRRPAFSFGDKEDAQRVRNALISLKNTANPPQPLIKIVETPIEIKPESTTTPPDSNLKPKPPS